MIIDIHAFSYWLLIGFLYSELFAKVLNFIEKHPCWLIFLSFRGAYDRGYAFSLRLPLYPLMFRVIGGEVWGQNEQSPRDSLSGDCFMMFVTMNFWGELFINLC